ncbi:Proteophosphoglycan ppg4 [Rhodotorula toruloides ATCC 204091]|uniref:BY PROTMAP: gi/342321174/gb/EGU13109.1/ Proteophosphoglycan ppg4 [Rhodotorula glutinis ATCC 204091] n=1 Tax=Rhodotorula toruloides TaxID=5286 RepID=A0A0K3CKH1_RHOTO|nr:Proteophosphoglycan ppg4 [Rhodotorula toruloides ATCC 204091]KAK4335331.1 Proteophosphoglycan ppg4 [Rhodotorula toruloides]PRQ71417.1 hypothetical protein AAT19DRAFT_10275 [Rhodotorula toruloides]
MAHMHAPRHRPEPLSLGPQSSQHTSNPAHRAQLLASLRSAPLPQHQQQYGQAGSYGGHASQARGYQNPQAAHALADFQHAQSAYMNELQATIQHQILVQQQMEREATYRLLAAQQQQPQPFAYPAQAPYSAGPHAGSQYAYQQQQHPHAQYATAPHLVQAQAQSQAQAQNPLVASALARRQRQEQQRRVSGPEHQPREHRSTPPASNRSTPTPPAVILSAPGEPYPDTSSGSESGETRPSTPYGQSQARGVRQNGGRANQQQQQQGKQSSKEAKAARRRSHLDTLTNTLSSATERRLRPAQSADQSLGASPRHPSPRNSNRSVSDSAMSSPSRAAAAAASNAAQLSPRAPAFAPSPPSPPTAYFSNTRAVPPPVPGTATATRQPRGPPTDFEATNFSARIRSKAIESLRARSGRSPAQNEHGQQASLAAPAVLAA